MICDATGDVLTAKRLELCGNFYALKKPRSDQAVATTKLLQSLAFGISGNVSGSAEG